MFVNNLKDRNKKNVKQVRRLLDKLDGLSDVFKDKCVGCTLKKECERADKCLR